MRDVTGEKNPNTVSRLNVSVVKDRLFERNFEFMDTSYLGGRYKHNIKCNTCNHEWSAMLQLVFANKSKSKGCPNCAGKVVSQDAVMERFLSKGFNPSTTPLKADERVECSCMICGDISFKSSSYFLKKIGYGCKKCSAPKGVDCYNYKELTEEERADRISRHQAYGAAKWSKEIKELADYTCDTCKIRGGVVLNSHHLHSWVTHPELRLEVTNGVCLCLKCHKQFHREFGNDVTPTQYIEFKETYNG